MRPHDFIIKDTYITTQYGSEKFELWNNITLNEVESTLIEGEYKSNYLLDSLRIFVNSEFSSIVWVQKHQPIYINDKLYRNESYIKTINDSFYEYDLPHIALPKISSIQTPLMQNINYIKCVFFFTK